MHGLDERREVRRFNLTLEILLADRLNTFSHRVDGVEVSISLLRFFSLIATNTRERASAYIHVSISLLRFFSLIGIELACEP